MAAFVSCLNFSILEANDESLDRYWSTLFFRISLSKFDKEDFSDNGLPVFMWSCSNLILRSLSFTAASVSVF